jgi:hypothetical protein
MAARFKRLPAGAAKAGAIDTKASVTEAKDRDMIVVGPIDDWPGEAR